MSGTEDKITLPPDSTGKNQRERKLTISGQTVYEDVVALDDGNGNLLDPRQVRALTSADVITALAGLSCGAVVLASYGIGIPDRTGLLGLNGPRDVFELANGNWLIADMLNQRVIEVNPKTKAIVWQYGTTGVAGSGANQLNQPYSAVRLANGDTLIADTGNNRIIEVTPQNAIVWSLTGADLSLANIYPTSVQFTDENTIVFGNSSNYPHVLEVAYPAKTLVRDWSTNCVPALSFPTYAHKIQGNESQDVTDFYNWHHILIVDWTTGNFYNLNADGTLLFSTPRYVPFGAHALECVDVWSNRIALLTSPYIGAIIAYIKAEKLDKLAVLFGNRFGTTWNGAGRAPPFLQDVGYCHRTPDGNLLISDYGSDTIYKVIPNMTKFLPPVPLYLWSAQSITDTSVGSTTPGFSGAYVDKKTFYIISNQTGTLNIQAWDEVASAFKTIASMAVAANTLTLYVTTYGARLMAINFVPSVAATVSAWAVLE